MGVMLSGNTPMALLYVLRPVAKAVPPAAESVMPWLSLWVLTSATLGKLGKVRGLMPRRPSTAAR